MSSGLDEKSGDVKSDVLSDFKKAAHALLDAVELGIFKEMRMGRDGSIAVSRRRITSAREIKFCRYREGECSVFASGLSAMRDDGSEIELEDTKLDGLCGGHGFFLDVNDAKRLVLKDQLETLLEREQDLAARCREASEERKKVEAEIAKLTML